MRWLYIDSVAGLSGDMMLGALIDLGLPLAHLEAELQKLPVFGYTLQAQRKMVGVLDTVKFDVVLDEPIIHGHTHNHEHHHEHRDIPAHGHDHSHEHTHTHDHGHAHSHSHDHTHTHDHGHEHAHGEHRSHRDIRTLIQESTLSSRVKESALSVFAVLAQAEAAVHGMSPDDVTFHEVGAVDSIVDIVGCAIGLAYFDITRVVCSPLPLGRGFVRCQHGLIPVPVPATLEMLAGVPVVGTEIEAELVTPTGAALAVALSDGFGPVPSFQMEAVGYGSGSRVLVQRPNLIRLLLGRPTPVDQPSVVMWQVECNLDDMTPEQIGFAVDQLRENGARDVWLTSLQMKKGRPGHLLSLLCEPHQLELFSNLLFAHTSTFGFRYFAVHREVLQREFCTLQTSCGPVTVKLGTRDGKTIQIAPEFDDCRRRAEEHGVTLAEVYAAALQAWREKSNN